MMPLFNMTVVNLTINSFITLTMFLAPAGTKSAMIEFFTPGKSSPSIMTAEVRNDGIYIYSVDNGKNSLFFFAKGESGVRGKYSLITNDVETEVLDFSNITIKPAQNNPSYKNIIFSDNTISMISLKEPSGGEIFEFTDLNTYRKIRIKYSNEESIIEKGISDKVKN